MNIPEIMSYEERAVDTVITTINLAKEKLGMRLNLFELANTAAYAWANTKVSLKSVGPPFAITAEKFICDTIEKHWKLTDVFMYHLKYMGGSKDEVSQYYYFEAVFSQPTSEYPIPQATVSVFFRIEDKHIELDSQAVPMMCFRIEGHHTDHDVRYVALTADWILAVIKMKIKFYKRLEELNLF
ncbi:uncharacterized protein LOC142980081 [Anticarsia gemmatalis]|uniref:uncharacterized protein LOC142980081 n=1 Tax=Anticarsia gemmatalis TaxID=129554 RepID=UPI003F76536D